MERIEGVIQRLLASAHRISFGLGIACAALQPVSAQAQVGSSQPAPQWHFHTGGLSHHFTQTAAQGRTWNQNHPGIGIEYRADPRARWSSRLTGGLMRDSRAFTSGYAGAAYVRQYNPGGSASAALGLGVYAFYRSSSWSGEMNLVPAVVPTLSLGLFRNKVGVNILAIPKIEAFGYTSTPLLFAQFTIRYN